ncbi:hypothetical protein J1605_015348 [Eschrichtius robustus]|uniref:glutathione transferase n=2 Tax=Eschrichtius robustus TaxID=9764 RepID=A0AB34GAH9_ESCRO|nr:hypothetical protein J1605_015348 [Eschrichtius robustus]
MGSYQGGGLHCCSSDPALGLLCSVSLALRGWSAPTMGLELYLDLLSQPCRAVYIFAKKNGIPFELCSVDLRKGQHLSDVFAQVNPRQKVPALKGGDFILTERTTQACAHVDEYLAWQHTTLRRNCLRLLCHKVMLPVYLGEPVSPEMLTATLAELDVTLQVFEDKFLQNKAFLAGPHISLADLIAITELMHPVGAGCQVFEGRPKLAAWHQRVEAAVGEVLFQEAHEVILKAKDSQPADPTIKRKLMPRVLSMIHPALILTPAPAMGLQLYLDLLSQPCRAVYIFAKKNCIPFELRTVDLLKGQHYSDDFAQVNPLRKVPALKDGDFTLAESVAILLYLTRKYEAPDHWYPQDLQARARVDEYLAWQHTALRTSCTRTMWQKMLFPVLLGQRVPPETLASTLAELDRCLQLLEDKFLKDQDFLSGPHISVADLVAITELMHPVSAGCDIFKSRPKLAAWRQRVEAAVGEDLFQEAHAVIMKAKDLPPADTAMKERLKPLAQLLLQ